MNVPLNVFEPFDAEWRRRFVDRWEVIVRFGAFCVSCPHGWSAQSRDLGVGEALAAHQATCPGCRA